MTLIKSFPAISAPDAKILILGTMPGLKSLEAGQYYAHPQNQFWKFMGALIGAGPDISYRQRLKIVKENHIAIWDVFKCCIRPGSLDSSIKDAEVNDFPAFFKKHPQIAHVFFDSGTAEKTYMKKVFPLVGDLDLTYTRIPSPSPAHASLSFEKKLKEWKKILNALPDQYETSRMI